MKRGTIEHPKTLALAVALRVRLLEAVGVLESLWHWTGRYARRGDIGQYPDAFIANGLHWHGPAERLIEALVAKRWLERHETLRLVVHDWHHHADEATRKTLARHGETFWNGMPPFGSVARQNPAGGATRARQCRDSVATESGQERDGVPPRARVPVPVPEPEPVIPPVAPRGAAQAHQPPTVEQCVALGMQAGVPEEYCRGWHRDMELAHWLDTNQRPCAHRWLRLLKTYWENERGRQGQRVAKAGKGKDFAKGLR